MARSELIRVGKDVKQFLEEEKKRVAEELGEEPTFDDVIRTNLDGFDGRSWQEEILQPEKKDKKPFLGI